MPAGFDAGLGPGFSFNAPKQIGQRLAGFVAKARVADLQIGDAVDAEAAKAGARFAPRG